MIRTSFSFLAWRRVRRTRSEAYADRYGVVVSLRPLFSTRHDSPLRNPIKLTKYELEQGLEKEQDVWETVVGLSPKTVSFDR